MPPDLDGRRILVTGGSMGIGLAVAQRLAESRDRIVLVGRSMDALDEALASLPGVGHQRLVLDVSDSDAWPGAVEAIDRGGHLDGVVTAAGVLGPIGGFDEISPADFAATIATNLTGTALALHHAIPRLRAAAGRAVTFSGGGATGAFPRYDAYAASKAAVVRLTENVAATGMIEINCVAPGFVATRMHEGTLTAGPDVAGPDYYLRTKEQLASGAFPASEAAELVVFLLSSEAQGISGRLISAQWDPWRDASFRDRLREDPDLGRLRRIDDQFFGRLDRSPVNPGVVSR